VSTFSVEFLGCKVSQTDAQAMRERLAGDGHAELAGGGEVHVVNGCCVTHEALRKTAQAARRAVRGGAARVFVTGCAANLGSPALEGLGERVVVVSGPSEHAPERVARELGATGCVGPAPGLGRTRAFVKVQDGCSFSCSFCVIPRVRGASRSRSAVAVLAEARRRAAAGHREIVVTGVNLGLFRDREARLGLPELILALAETDGVERVRLSSIEVNHLSDRLCDTLAHPRVCPHLHVPLQSGDDGVLRDMARRYTAAGYAAKVGRARERIPGLNLTADAIVGFPSEDEAAFARTCALVRDLAVSKVHVFPYSPRPGTTTEARDPVPPAVKRSRSERLRSLSDVQGLARRRAKIGGRERVLVERRDARGRLHGYGADYTAFRLAPAAHVPVGAVVDVIGERADESAVIGRIA
jgi:threonylcarbamoyladenosine tRNA methylthiotransferase MtaB